MPSIFVPREIREGETRVAAIPETVQRLTRDGFSVSVQRGAGVRSVIVRTIWAACQPLRRDGPLGRPWGLAFGWKSKTWIRAVMSIT